MSGTAPAEQLKFLLSWPVQAYQSPAARPDVVMCFLVGGVGKAQEFWGERLGLCRVCYSEDIRNQWRGGD